MWRAEGIRDVSGYRDIVLSVNVALSDPFGQLPAVETFRCLTPEIPELILSIELLIV